MFIIFAFIPSFHSSGVYTYLVRAISCRYIKQIRRSTSLYGPLLIMRSLNASILEMWQRILGYMNVAPQSVKPNGKINVLLKTISISNTKTCWSLARKNNIITYSFTNWSPKSERALLEKILNVLRNVGVNVNIVVSVKTFIIIAIFFSPSLRNRANVWTRTLYQVIKTRTTLYFN